MRRSNRWIWCLLAFGWLPFCGGCRSVPVNQIPSTTAGVSHPSPTVVTNTPAQPRHFSTWQKLNPVWWFGNADSPVAPDSYRPGESHRDFRWHLRNPCHNFTFFVIGIADKPFTRAGRFPESNFNPNGGWNWAVCRYRWLRLPFVSYQHGGFKFYCGWRSGGNFGMELKLAEKQTAPRRKPEEETPPPEPKNMGVP